MSASPVESGQHDLFTNTGFASTGSSNSGILTLQSGLIYRWPGVHLTPFVHGLGGGAYVDGPDHEPYTWGPVITGGGGLDWYFGCHFGIRVFEADYEYIHANSGPSSGTLAAATTFPGATMRTSTPFAWLPAWWCAAALPTAPIRDAAPCRRRRWLRRHTVHRLPRRTCHQ
jgi:hypothetical protein